MENRQTELQQCREEVQELKQRLNLLSARLDRLEQPAKAQPAAAPKPQPKPQPAVKKEPEEHKNLESAVGKNLFAVLASVLVLLGVGVFISTIYEHIPEFVKILAIYAFGFVVLGVGLVLYRRKGNNFWLGVASCGLAELLVSIIASHLYFEVLSLTMTFALVLVWILGSSALTKIQPTVFKTIGFVGFIISMLLGLNADRSLATYLVLLPAYGALSVFFLTTNRGYVKMNTVLAFASVICLPMFADLQYFLFLAEMPEWLSFLLILGILAVLHAVYLFPAKLRRDVYPIFALSSLSVVWLYASGCDLSVWIPTALVLVLGLWSISHLVDSSRTARMIFSIFAAAFLAVIAQSIYHEVQHLYIWFAVATAAAYGLYYWTKKRDIAWIGLVCFLVIYQRHYMFSDAVVGLIALGALALFILNSTKLLRRDDALQTAWYVVLFFIAHTLLDQFKQHIYQDPNLVWDNIESANRVWDRIDTVNGLFYTLMTVINTIFLHRCLRDQVRIMRITPKAVVVMALQVYLFFNCMDYVDSHIWYISFLSIAASMLILSHSLHYTFKTGGTNKNLMVWQFIKFSLYCWAVLWILDSPSILINISLLLIAIGAVLVGFRLGHKSVRVYGLALSLVDVVCLVLFNIDFSDSLQLAGGIVLCGVLCFVISFIYSRLSKSSLAKREIEEA